ncbi:hypothetical protein ILUMI_06676 [Ignelater luminosus]|uniref:Large ribosomal subunit protein mL52 n=1 Tax=Ignelater luminosus TaxID=2038154 RepID=A0A8K0GH02_IGNLU|nr:hypothetical protein ILUMI_06676 [Ignelater luminosus]
MAQTVLTISSCLSTKILNSSQLRFISTTSVKCLDQRWREKRGLPMNPNKHGVLTDSPDYSYLDGRPTPYGARQQKRMLKQKAIAEQIMQLTKEVDFAVERHEKLQLEEEEKKREIIANKLKPKGLLLLKNK